MSQRGPDAPDGTVDPNGEVSPSYGWRRPVSILLAFLAAMLVTVPTTGDIGLTWDEPAYRFSQLRSDQWWERLAHARNVADLQALLEPDALLFYWTYARHGINFHPPLAGQLDLLAYHAFGGWMADMPARRMASVIEYVLTATLAFAFLSRRYGAWVGIVAAGALLTMPRVYGDGHIAGTDTPGLLLWAAAALAFWKGINEPGARRWRVLVGILLGLAFVEKMGAVFVVGPLLLWLILTRLPRVFKRGSGPDWTDGLVTSTLMLLPLAVTFVEILRLSRFPNLPQPKFSDLFMNRPRSYLSGAILTLPLLVWVLRRVLGRLRPDSPVWGVERPALEQWTSMLAFGPVVAWLGNPAWWRETLPRLAHYYQINTDRRGSLPDIQVYYLNQIYEYSLPWHNAWVLIVVTVPASLLLPALLGLVCTVRNTARDRLPLYFLLHMSVLPIMRMLPTPGHDGVRLFLPTFFFLAAFTGWGTDWPARVLASRLPDRRRWLAHAGFAALVLGPSAYQLARVHPFELSYYNEFAGGPKRAWETGNFELTYWYDAFNPRTLEELNAKLPRGAQVDFLNSKTEPMTFMELQSLGALRPDILLGWQDLDQFPYVWLLTQDSKASAFTRLLFAMTPWYARTPTQLDGLRVATVADPVAVSRAYALRMLLDVPDDQPPDRAEVPDWVRKYTPFLKRFWGEGLTKIAHLNTNKAILDWALEDPKGLLAAAQGIAARRKPGDDPGEQRLWRILTGHEGERFYAQFLMRARPEALVEAVQIVISRPDAVRTVMTRYPYTDPETVGGPLDKGLPRLAD